MKYFRCVSIAALSLTLALSALPASAQRLLTNPAVARGTGGSTQNPTAGLPLRFTSGTSFATGGTTPVAVGVGDFNHDDKQDVVVVNQDQSNVAVLLGHGDGTFAAPVTYNLPSGVPVNVAVADINGDGNLDIAVITEQVNGFISNVFVLLGNGNGSFSTAITTPSSVNGLAIHAADINGDGKQDVVIGSNGDAAVLYGKGDGTFQSPIILNSARGGLVDAAVGDINGDGRLDLVCAVSNPKAGIAVFLQNSNGTFSAGQAVLTSEQNGAIITLGDFNHDGKLDALLAAAPLRYGAAFIFAGNGDGTFQAGTPQFPGYKPVSVATADFNHDGLLDAAFASYEPAPPYQASDVFVFADDSAGNLSYNQEFQDTTGGTRGMAIADFNGDGWPDIVTADSLGNKVTLLLNLVGANSGPQQFVPITPCRLIDTRSSGPIGGGYGIGISLPALGACGASLPAGASAFSLNITVLPIATLPYLSVWPAGGPFGTNSLANSPDGRVRANAVIAPAGNAGAIAVYFPASTNLLMDVNGYFVPASQSTLAFYPLTPCRVLDTRTANGPLGGPYLQGGAVRDFPVLDSNCSIPSDAQAYSMNFTAAPYHGEDLGYLTVWGKGNPQPGVSTLNNPTATTVANGAIVQAGTSGEISVYASGNTQLLGDINGYFAPAQPGGLSLYTVQPCRAIDTRQQGGAFEGQVTENIAMSPCAPPSTAQAYVMNATAVPDGTLNYLTLWPNGQGRPTVSTLNAIDGTATSNMAIVGTTNGEIDAYASGTTNLILDLFGYFAP